MADGLRIPPHNLEAEKAVIGACLLERDSLLFVTETLQPDDFYDMRHRKAFDLIFDMAHKDKPVDSLTFMEEAQKTGVFQELGGQPFLAELVDSVTSTANVEYHSHIVREKSVHRKLVQVGGDIIRLGYAEDKDLSEVLDEAERAVFEISQRGGEKIFKHIGEVMGPTFSQIEEMFHKGEPVTGIETGFVDFDKLTGGLQPGTLNIVAARPSMGKTALALNIAQYAAMKKHSPVLMFSLEMGAEQLVQRMLGAESRINIHDLRTGTFHENSWTELARAAGELAEAPIYIDDSSVLNTMELRARCRRFKAQHKEVGLVVVDYLQLMSMPKRIESKQQEVAEISRALKAVARELEVPVMALSQLSRAVESRNDKRPMLSDLRDSGAIEQDADLVMLLYRPGYYNSDDPEQTDNAAEVILAKHRNGPTGTVHMVFLREYARFVSSAGRDFARN